MKTTYISKGYKITVTGFIPQGKDSLFMYSHIDEMNTKKGIFLMGVEHKDCGYVSIIKFKKI